MGNKKRVEHELDSKGVKKLTEDEIKIILRGADDLIMSGGRAMLAKILGGSKDKKLLDLELDYSPVYGSFKGETQKEILAKIDWVILNHYLDIEYDGRLPLLVFTDKGWKIERETYAVELLYKLIEASENLEYEFVETLKDRNRGLILLLLDKVVKTQNKDLIPILQAWQMIDYKKLKVRIQEVMDILEKEGSSLREGKNDVLSFEANKKWLSIPETFRKQIEKNVWCSSCCDAVQIVNYTVKEKKEGILLHGECRKCGNEVVRVVD